MFVCQMKFSENGFLSLKQLHCNSAYLPLTQYLALKASPSGIYSTLHRLWSPATQRCLSCQQGSKFISKDQSLLPLYTILNQSEGKGTDRKNQDLNKFHPALIMLCPLFSKGQDLQYLQPPPPLVYSCPWLFPARCLWSKFHNECRSDKCLVRRGFFSVPPQHHQLSMAFFLPQTSFMCY